MTADMIFDRIAKVSAPLVVFIEDGEVQVSRNDSRRARLQIEYRPETVIGTYDINSRLAWIAEDIEHHAGHE